ncbi:MAG TPA: hypothetical protein H9871_00450 [Candidatus Nesterenkonia stercoripullorum]|uniref:Phosphotyrosine protein phosphatase I domain-containing protein n=1 Tax=Candidatus Nesterenkonia stercoripullorum TaxID=2838701 RepID=A0A9D1RZ17_9MICC|nr:hypothetical protein [Candidatus Nesterenkonia stercoripullorum]
MPTSRPFTVLTVCTGNICRSPAMERLLRYQFGEETGIRIHSGGLAAHDGEDMQPPMKQRVREYGADSEDFTARQITSDMLEEADLILAATRDHVQDMISAVPDAAERTFTVPELGELLAQIDVESLPRDASSPAETLSAVVTAVEAVRSDQGRQERTADDVVDPYMLPEGVYDEAFEQIRGPLEALGDRVLRAR